jgi:hypothetical protein
MLKCGVWEVEGDLGVAMMMIVAGGGANKEGKGGFENVCEKWKMEDEKSMKFRTGASPKYG